MSSPIDTGSIVTLFYLSPTKDTGIYVRATIFNAETDAVLATRDLAHVADGAYSDATYFMPSAKIKVRYDPYEDASYTASACDEGSVDERFHPSETPSEIIRNDEIELIFDDTDESIDLVFEEDDSFTLAFDDGDEAIELIFDDTDESIELVFSDSDSFELTFHDC